MDDQEPNLEAAHARCALNRGELEASTTCGCFYCCQSFPPSEIAEWIDEPEGSPQGAGQTAVCPRCGIDSVIGSTSGFPIEDAAFLRRMHAHWFS